ncbi:MAG: phosphatase PAP2 family protein [Burkholderiales bacterium]|nr:phosphatase PAP2 family protein [Burkholderiales bacterium]
MYKALFLAATILIALCVQYLDIGIATFIAEHTGAKFLFGQTVSSLPDLLFVIVIVASAYCWLGYFRFARRGIENRLTRSFQIAGTSLPLAYIAKDILKWVFGRTETRTWLTEPDLYAFHWFQGGPHFQGFPSGHMLVFTPLFLALWDYCPRLRLPVIFAWTGLALALMITEYHFLGDVLAGSCLGILVHLGARRYFTLKYGKITEM